MIIYLLYIRPHESLQQWANRVRGPLQELLSKRGYSLYHVFCLFASFGQVESKTYYINGELYSNIVDLVSIRAKWLFASNAGN